MSEIRVLVNGNEYSEEEFREDLTRMFDTYRCKDNSNMGNMNCNGVSCDDCPLYKASCNRIKSSNSFKTIATVYEWALEHPIKTNKDKIKEVFGIDELEFLCNINVENRMNWLNKEYEEPKG